MVKSIFLFSYFCYPTKGLQRVKIRAWPAVLTQYPLSVCTPGIVYNFALPSGMYAPELSIESSTSNKTDFESRTTITLKCSSVSNPSPSYHWFKDGTLVANSNTTTGLLVLSNSTVDDSGSYTCETRNELGNMTSNAIDIHIWGMYIIDLAH